MSPNQTDSDGGIPQEPAAPLQKFNPDINPDDVVSEAARTLKCMERRRPAEMALEELKSNALIAAERMPERFRKVEELLERALAKAGIETAGRKRLAELSPEQRDCNLLMIETLTTLFEEYRSLTYQMRDLCRSYLELRETMEEMHEALLAWMKQTGTENTP